jgi:DNA invertase Pin-like site-specific DNA recombinase
MRKSNSDRPSANDQTPPVRIKACAYLRSATKHDISVPTQRERLMDMADRDGFEIIEWYVDQGSGRSSKRKGWLKLLTDAATAEWEVVLCLNRERFNRLDHIEQGVVLQKLQKTGKRLHTAVEGPLDWDATAGEIIDKMIDAENKNGTSPTPKPIKACGYLRMSTDQQTTSTPIQRACLLELAQQEGYEIVQWYTDEGCTGSRKTQKRAGWLRLLAEAPAAQWQVVLCHSYSRLSRYDSIEAGYAKQVLRKAKKTIHCAVEGARRLGDRDWADHRLDLQRTEPPVRCQARSGHAPWQTAGLSERPKRPRHLSLRLRLPRHRPAGGHPPHQPQCELRGAEGVDEDPHARRSQGGRGRAVALRRVRHEGRGLPLAG